MLHIHNKRAEICPPRENTLCFVIYKSPYKVKSSERIRFTENAHYSKPCPIE